MNSQYTPRYYVCLSNWLIESWNGGKFEVQWDIKSSDLQLELGNMKKVLFDDINDIKDDYIADTTKYYTVYTNIVIKKIFFTIW